MAPPNHIEKKWIARQIRYASSLKTLVGVQRFQDSILEILEDETKPKPRSVTARDMTSEQVIEVFGLKASIELWKQREENYDTPRSLTLNLSRLKEANYDKSSEAYSRIAIDFLIIACMVTHKHLQSKQPELSTNQSRLPANDPTATTSPILEQPEHPTNNPYNQTATIVPILDQATKIAGPLYIAPDTPPKITFQPLPIKVFPEMALSVQVKRGNQEWHVSGVADWAMGYGDRAALEDGAVLLAVEAKWQANLYGAEPQLLTYLATIRQLRIQANKKNVMTQGFFSDGRMYRFLCIRNNGTVMISRVFDISLVKEDLKSVFNFLLGMLTTAAESSPNTSPIKSGLEQDERIENFDQGVFVEVFEDIGADSISSPEMYYHEMEEEDELPDITIEE